MKSDVACGVHGTHLEVGCVGHEALEALAPHRPHPGVVAAIDEAGGAARVGRQFAKALHSAW